MITITYDKEAADKMNAIIKEIVIAHENLIGAHTEKVVRHGILEVKETIAEKGLVGDGNFIKSINGRVFRNKKGRWSGVVGAPSPAHFLEMGTRPHIIRPRLDRAHASVIDTRRGRKVGRGASLAWKEGGAIRFAKEVHHPGTKPQNVFRDASVKTSKYALKELELMLARIKFNKWKVK